MLFRSYGLDATDYINTSISETEANESVYYYNGMIVNDSEVKFSLYDAVGNEVLRSNKSEDISSLPKGIYIVKTENVVMKIRK